MSQNWKAVAQVRKKMKDNGVEKIRGCSWIELEGVIHEFIAFDKSHAQFESVYLVLDSLASQLEPENFVLTQKDYKASSYKPANWNLKILFSIMDHRRNCFGSLCCKSHGGSKKVGNSKP
nr:pentatricopeptide repeat-containing protein At1g50270 [Ipomoea trifida]